MENLWALIKGNLPVFVMFYASWCPHCRKMLPIVRKLENNKHLNLQCFDIDDPANRRLVDYYQVQACLLYTSPSPRDQRGSRMPSSA